MTKRKKSRIVDVSKSAAACTPSTADGVLKQILEEARALPAGSDVEGFMEHRLQELTQSVRQEVAHRRAKDQAAASQEADFSPSALP